MLLESSPLTLLYFSSSFDPAHVSFLGNGIEKIPYTDAVRLDMADTITKVL